MKVSKQLIVLGLFKIKRYSVNVMTGDIISHCGLQDRILAKHILPSGYVQYGLDMGFKEIIPVYEHQLVYLYHYNTTYNPKYVIDHIDRNKQNNSIDNLRCITQVENMDIPDKGKGFAKGTRKRVRIPLSERHLILKGWQEGKSHVQLGLEFKTTRQTVSRIINELNGNLYQ
jgi:HNH endonuclease